MGDPYPPCGISRLDGLTRGRHSERVPASFGFARIRRGLGRLFVDLRASLALRVAMLARWSVAFSFVAVLSVFPLRGFVMACSWCFQAQAASSLMALPL